MAAPTFEQMRPRYTNFWRDMRVQNIGVLDAAAAKLLRNKVRYEKVGKPLGIPWWWIAICHHRESSGNFAGVLHNGEHIIGTGRKTRLVPAGRGPFASWEEAAVDAHRRSLPAGGVPLDTVRTDHQRDVGGLGPQVGAAMSRRGKR